MADFAVIFDMDGVIVDTNVFHKDAIHQFCKKYGFSLTEEQLRTSIYGRTNKDWLTNLFGTLTPEQLHAYAHEKEQLFRDLYAPHIKPVKGLLQFLESLSAQSIVAAIATSAPPENVAFVLSHIPIRKYFNVILDERVVTYGKPDPEIYIKTAAALGFKNEKCIIIEDSLSGVTSGRRSGSKVIGITTTHTREELTDASYIINDFDELKLSVLPDILQK